MSLFTAWAVESSLWSDLSNTLCKTISTWCERPDPFASFSGIADLLVPPGPFRPQQLAGCL